MLDSATVFQCDTTAASGGDSTSGEASREASRQASREASREASRHILSVAVRIRAFETNLLQLFKQGLISGTVHTCVGQELCAAALHPHLRPGRDAFFATHRGHGHYLAHAGSE